MKVVDPESVKVYTDDHPTGALHQRYLLQGKEHTPENFMFSIAETVKRFEMERHRHNFEQFRMPLKGNMSLGDGRILKEGTLAYFPEGAFYGPQDDEAGPVALVLQFGGPSGYGYMSPQQYRAGRESLKKVGRFDDAVFIPNEGVGDGRKKFSINAIWEEAMGTKMLIPAPRYDQAIFMDPAAFRWVPVKGVSGVYRKHLGTYSEREVSAEMWMLKPGASFELSAGEEIRILFVLEGSGQAGSEALGKYFAVQVDPGETALLKANEELKFMSFNLPPVKEDWLDADLPSFEPVPEESVKKK
jgi:hypothetical protein